MKYAPHYTRYRVLVIAVCLLSVTVTGCQPRIPKISRLFMFGIKAQDLTVDLRNYLGFSDKVFGVVVQDVIPSLVADVRGFQKGDVIERVDGEPVTGAKDLIRKVNKGAPVIVVDCVRRIPGGEKLYIVQIPLDNAPPLPNVYKTSVKLDWQQFNKLIEYIYQLFASSDAAAAI
jgi:S1-C subfamily serine protease